VIVKPEALREWKNVKSTEYNGNSSMKIAHHITTIVVYNKNIFTTYYIVI
jgi:hypothetical protein